LGSKENNKSESSIPSLPVVDQKQEQPQPVQEEKKQVVEEKKKKCQKFPNQLQIQTLLQMLQF